MDGLGNADSILECPICKKTYDDPRILPCQHTICEKCLSSYVRQVTQEGGKQMGEFPCPVCKRNTKLRDASTFQRNFTIVALLDSKIVKARIRKASSRMENRTVTVGTQTSVEEAVTNSNETSESLLQDIAKPTSDAKDTENDSGHVYTGLKANKENMARDKGRRNENIDTDTKDYDNKFEKSKRIELFLSIVNRQFPDVFFALYLLFLFDLLLCITVCVLPVLVFLLICVDLIVNFSDRSNTLRHLFKSHTTKEKRWWHEFLMFNIDLMVDAAKLFLPLIIWIVIFNFIYTFHSAITKRQSVFTFEVLLEKIAIDLSSVAYNVYKINEMFTIFIECILQQLIY